MESVSHCFWGQCQWNYTFHSAQPRFLQSKMCDILCQCSGGTKGEPDTIVPLWGLPSSRVGRPQNWSQKRRENPVPLERKKVLWALQEGGHDGWRDQKGSRKRKNLRWFLKRKKNFNRKKSGSSKIRAGYSGGRAQKSTVKTLGILEDFRYQEPLVNMGK